MKAILIKDEQGPADNLYVGEVDKPSLRAGEVLVQIKAFGLNRMDISQREGRYPPPAGSSHILGVEFSGIVTEIGDTVQHWNIGDAVFGLVGGGAYAEYVRVPEAHLIKKPEHLTWVEAAGIPENFLTAFQALVVIGKVQKDDHVLVHAGASGVGVAAIQLARIYNAQTVTATTSTQEKIDWLLGLPRGATHAANYKTQDFANVVKQVTDDHGADVVIDFVGQAHFNKNIIALANDGRMTMLALLSGATVDSVNLAPILQKRLHIEGSTLRARSLSYQADLISQFKEVASEKITGQSGQGPIHVYIHKVYSWHNIVEAHKEMEADKNLGKIVIQVD